MLLELGGRHIGIGQSPDEGHVVLADPEGDEFCLIEPGDEFLAGCGRLGAINCGGTRKVGYFWSEALGWPLVGIRTRRPRPLARRHRSAHHLEWPAADPEDRQERAPSRHRSARRGRAVSCTPGHWYQGQDRADGTWDIYDIRGEDLIGEDEDRDVIRPYRERGRPASAVRASIPPDSTRSPHHMARASTGSSPSGQLESRSANYVSWVVMAEHDDNELLCVREPPDDAWQTSGAPAGPVRTYHSNAYTAVNACRRRAASLPTTPLMSQNAEVLRPWHPRVDRDLAGVGRHRRAGIVPPVKIASSSGWACKKHHGRAESRVRRGVHTCAEHHAERGSSRAYHRPVPGRSTGDDRCEPPRVPTPSDSEQHRPGGQETKRDRSDTGDGEPCGGQQVDGRDVPIRSSPNRLGSRARRGSWSRCRTASRRTSSPSRWPRRWLRTSCRRRSAPIARRRSGSPSRRR